jgi:hypothetical protein
MIVGGYFVLFHKAANISKYKQAMNFLKNLTVADVI